MAEVIRSTRIDLKSDSREIMIDSLNGNLADTLYGVLASKFAHWNVKGSGFFPAHQLFDRVYEFYSEAADILGERVTALGGNAEGLLNDIAVNSAIAYTASASDNVHRHVVAMADLLGQIANNYRSAIKLAGSEEVVDHATQDVFIELTRKADTLMYFLESELRES